jgi:hypothetical protein
VKWLTPREGWLEKGSSCSPKMVKFCSISDTAPASWTCVDASAPAVQILFLEGFGIVVGHIAKRAKPPVISVRLEIYWEQIWS